MRVILHLNDDFVALIGGTTNIKNDASLFRRLRRYLHIVKGDTGDFSIVLAQQTVEKGQHLWLPAHQMFEAPIGLQVDILIHSLFGLQKNGSGQSDCPFLIWDGI